jgi:hypothetical protein
LSSIRKRILFVRHNNPYFLIFIFFIFSLFHVTFTQSQNEPLQQLQHLVSISKSPLNYPYSFTKYCEFKCHADFLSWLDMINTN